jgi:uncharacterized protein (DUF58 family)
VTREGSTVTGNTKSFSVADLVPGYEARQTLKSARFAPRAAGGAVQKLKTPGRVPEETRPYQAGDPVHLIDWHAFGRTDQLIVRQRREQAPQHVMIHLTLHDSMNWPGSALGSGAGSGAGSGEGVVKGSRPDEATKAELAWRCAMFMAYALIRRGDVVEMAVDSLTGVDSIWRPAGSRMILDTFEWLRANSFTTEAIPANLLPLVSTSARMARPRRVIFSDGLREDGKLSADLTVEDLEAGDLFVHVLSDLEVTDNWRSAGDVYIDNERTGPAAREWQGQWLADRVPAARQAWLAGMDAKLARGGVVTVRVTGSLPAVALIASFESWCGGMA